MTLLDVESAPLRHAISLRIRAAPEAVFDKLADAAGWVQWFPLVKRATWVSTAHSGVGAVREIDLLALGSYRECMLAWEPGARFAFTITASTSPLVNRMVEDYRLVAVEGETRLDWSFAAVPTFVGRLTAPALRTVLSQLIQRGGAGIERTLQR